jgi:hypothetical protein
MPMATSGKIASQVITARPGYGGRTPDLLITVVTLCDGWPVLPQIDALLAGGGTDRAARRRAFVVRTATLMARALLDDASAAVPESQAARS